MAGEWRSVRLGDICTKLGSGATPRGGSAVYVETGPFALIRSQNVHTDGFRHDGLAYISIEHAAELANVEVLRDDVLLNITGDSVARACQVDAGILPARVNQHVTIIRPDRHILDARFLRYYLVSPAVQSTLRSWAASGATRNALTKDMIASLNVNAPEALSEQRAIAHILGTLDDKIELNRRMSETLEAMARALFKSWFIDFDPVRAKAEGRDPGLPKPIADLFPARLVDSERGKIPEGWQVTSIGDLAEVVGGSTPKTERREFWGGGTHHWATPKDLSGRSLPVLFDTERRVTDAGLTQISSGLLPQGTVLLSSRAPIGYLAIAEVPVAINQGFIAMMPRPGISNLFLLRWADAAREQIVSCANGSTFLEISKGNFRPLRVIAPEAPVMGAFDRLTRPMYRQVVERVWESRTLAAQRDTLLPTLLSGTLRVRNATP